MSGLASGRLDQRITLQQQVESRGAEYADAQRSWADVATVWAAVEPLAGREYFANLEVHGELTCRVTIRYRAGVHEKMRVVHGARIYEIVSPPIDPLGRHVELQLMCKEIRSG